MRVLDDWVNLADSEPAAGLVATFSTLEYNQELGRLLVVDWTGRVGYWDTESWEFNVILDQSDIYRLRVHPSARFAVSAERDGSLRVRDPESLEAVGAPLVGHQAAVGFFERAIYFFGDNQLVRSGTSSVRRVRRIGRRASSGLRRSDAPQSSSWVSGSWSALRWLWGEQ